MNEVLALMNLAASAHTPKGDPVIHRYVNEGTGGNEYRISIPGVINDPLNVATMAGKRGSGLLVLVRNDGNIYGVDEVASGFVVVGAKYLHKGSSKLYTVDSLALDEEGGFVRVVYSPSRRTATGFPEFWDRPLTEFLQKFTYMNQGHIHSAVIQMHEKLENYYGK